MRKIPSELENPLDDIFIKLGDQLSSYFKSLHMTANDLTTVSVILGFASLYFFIIKQYLFSSILFLLSYMFDCFDGFYARKYDMVSKFGDYYDHITDYIIDGTLIVLIGYKYWGLQNNNPKKYLPLLIIFAIIMATVHIGCQEKYSNKQAPDILSSIQGLCPASEVSSLEKVLRFTRFFGTGTYTIILCSLILMSYSVDNDLLFGR